MEEGSFPRGRVVLPKQQDWDKQPLRNPTFGDRKKRSSIESCQGSNRSDDILFGKRTSESSKSDTKVSRKKQKKGAASVTSNQSLLPLGGGAVVTGKSGEPLIESLGFSKLSKGFRLLGCVREVHSDLAVFSLPNLWTGYMLRPSEDHPACDEMLQVGQFLSVVVVRAVQERVQGGAVRRRIQVTCLPSAVNRVTTLKDSLDTTIREVSTRPGNSVRCQVVSIEDHGVLMDIGINKRGFLAFSDIDDEYAVDDDVNMEYEDQSTLKKYPLNLVEGRILDCFVKEGKAVDPSIISLSLPSRRDIAKSTVPASTVSKPTLSQLQPGMLVQAKVERAARDGLCVTFYNGLFRGAIEVQHLGGFWLPKHRQESDEWRSFFNAHRSFTARIIATEVSTKIIRLSLLSHLLEMEPKDNHPEVGTVIKEATVVRLDPGVGALLAYEDARISEGKPRPGFVPISSDESYLEACRMQGVYVHISKASDNTKEKFPEEEFAKEFAPSTKHNLRIVGSNNWIEGIASGSTAPSIVEAHVLTHADIKAGAVYKQVNVISLLEKGSALVDLGMGVKGLIPEIHLFEQTASSDYRAQLRKAKYSVGAKVDVRVLSVDPKMKKCILTAKKSLLKTERVIMSFGEARIGMRGTGFVSTVDSQGLIVTFFNGVYGRVTARTLSMEAGVENHNADYSVGDVMECKVAHIKEKYSRSKHGDNSATNISAGQDPKYIYRELTLGLVMQGKHHEDVEEPQHQKASGIVQLNRAAILPSNSMRVVELIPSKPKDLDFVPGYAIVNVQTKHILRNASGETVHAVDCKLPFDQLFDDYDPTDIVSAHALDNLACTVLAAGKKVPGKAILIFDPQKSATEYNSGTGSFATVSLRPQLVDSVAKGVSKTNEDDHDLTFPSPESSLYKGARCLGYVSNIDRRHGAFVKYCNGLSGLVSKKKGGLLLRKFSTVKTEILSVDENSMPPKLLVRVLQEMNIAEREIISDLKAGDIIEEATITNVSFHQASVVFEDKRCGPRETVKARIHCTMAAATVFDVKNSRSGEGNTEQVITSCHPFYGWKVGEQLKSLRVLKVECTRRNILVELSNASNARLYSNRGVPDDGETVDGIIYSISAGSGLWISISPGMMCHVPALEITEDVKLLNTICDKVPVGAKIRGSVLNGDRWSQRRSKYQYSKPRETEKGKRSTPFVSLLTGSKESTLFHPRKGDILVGRINRSLVEVQRPAVMLDLRCGFVGRCCITELNEPDDWENMPLAAHVGSTETKKNGELRNASNKKKPQDCRFVHGKFVQCRVMEEVNPEALVEVSFRKSRLEGDLEDDRLPVEGEQVQGYVASTNKKGCFLRLSRHLDGRVILKELSDGFVSNPEASFPVGRLVIGKVKAVSSFESEERIRPKLDLDLRESILLDGTKLRFAHVKVGKIYKGTITRLEDYGVFVRIDSSEVSGLAHKSECSDSYIRSLKNIYDPGDKVKLLVIKKDEGKKTIGFSLKASRFTAIDDSDDEWNRKGDSDDELMGDASDSVDKNDAELGSITRELQDQSEGEDDDARLDIDSKEESSEDESQSSEESDGLEDKDIIMDTNVGFDWDNDSDNDKEIDDSDNESDTSENDNSAHRPSHKSRRRQAQRRKEEEEISKREVALADGTADEHPETDADFERLLASKPNSSELWIRFMAFHLSLADVAAARKVAERSFERIEFRKESEKLNVWCALLTLELKYGTENSLKAAFNRACQQNNPKHIHLRFAEIMEKDDSSSALVTFGRIDELYKKMCKKFKCKKQVWLSYMKFLLRNNREEEALALSKRSFLSLPSYKHTETMSKIAQLVFEYGNVERARTLFDGLLRKFPKRLDIFFVYADKEVKHGEVDIARSLYERVCNPRDETLVLRLSDKKMKSFFKKWYTFEESHGTEENMQKVKEAAKDYVERSLS